MQDTHATGRTGKRRRDRLDEAEDEMHSAEPKRHNHHSYSYSHQHTGFNNNNNNASSSNRHISPSYLQYTGLSAPSGHIQADKTQLDANTSHMHKEYDKRVMYAQQQRHAGTLQTPATSPPSLAAYSPGNGTREASGGAIAGGSIDDESETELELDPSGEYYHINLLLNKLHHERAMRSLSSNPANSSSANSSSANSSNTNANTRQ